MGRFKFVSQQAPAIVGVLSKQPGDEESKISPDPSDALTVLGLSYMCHNDYFNGRNRSEWIDLNPAWNVSSGFGWDADGLRGYVFVSADKSIAVISFKGTTASLFGIGGDETSARDKYNDNAMFSCCCAKVDASWRPICDCASKGRTCDSKCVSASCNFTESYYNMALNITDTVARIYPNADIWMTGHSLGGALAALVALTYQIPAFAFEAPGEALFAERIGLLPSDPFERYIIYARSQIYHFGNDGDPIFLGQCRGPSSACYFSGYAMESKCHTGKVCLYRKKDDAKTREAQHKRQRVLQVPSTNQHVDIRYHQLSYLISNYLEKRDSVPDCIIEFGCKDCEEWTFT